MFDQSELIDLKENYFAEVNQSLPELAAFMSMLNTTILKLIVANLGFCDSRDYFVCPVLVVGGDRGTGAQENRGREGYGRRERKGREAGVLIGREAGEKCETLFFLSLTMR